MRRSIRLPVSLLIASCFSSTAAWSAEENGTAPAALRPAAQVRLNRTSAWISFLTRHGEWRAVWNEETGTPHRAYGPAIALPGFAAADDASRRALALDFLDHESEALGIDPARLRLKRFQKIGVTWYASYVQTHGGFDVLFSEVELRIGEGGGVTAAGAVYYRGLDGGLEGDGSALLLPETELLARTVERLGGGGSARFSDGEGILRILPIPNAPGVSTVPGHSFHLVRTVRWRGPDPMDARLLHVDARSGEILREQSIVRDAGAAAAAGPVGMAGPTGVVTGTIRPVLPSDSAVTRPFEHQFVIIGADTAVTDSTGSFTGEAALPETVVARMEGEWVAVTRGNGPEAKLELIADPADSIAIVWDDGDSHAAERNAYYHATFAHRFVKGLDPAFTGLDYPLPVTVNMTGLFCNAFWDGTGINFFLGNVDCVNSAYSPSTVYHEYGHAVNDRLYQQAGAEQLFNPVVHEATADAFACLIEDTPLYARGFWGEGTHTRTLDNTRQYPVDLVGQPHRDGLILGGALWDLRAATTLETARTLVHMAKWGLPDDDSYGLACAEWFTELLVADDDDGNLGNGTPNAAAIEAAFGGHGIGTNLFYTLSFSHTPYPSTADVLHDYILSFSLSGSAAPRPPDATIVVRYTTDGFATQATVPAIPITGSGWLAVIPSQSPGTLVEYYMEATDDSSGLLMRFPYGAPGDDAYAFLVGPYTAALVNNFESAAGWTAGVPGDNATAGDWELAAPPSTFNGWRGVQPGADHSTVGTRCFVTQSGGGLPATGSDVDGGRTTLLSPVFDLTSAENPVIGYYRWYSNNLGDDPRGDSWKVEISGDGGLTWTMAESSNVPANFWKRIYMKPSHHVAGLGSVRLRFIASDFGTETLVEALIDDFEILTTNGVVLAVDERVDPAIPSGYALAQNYPNPFNGATVITFSIPAALDVSLRMYDMVGREVGSLVDGRRGPGTYSVSWAPDGLPSGVYECRLTAGTFTSARKLVYLK